MTGNLFNSAFEGDFQSIKEQVDSNASLCKSVDEDKRTLLHWAGKFTVLHLVVCPCAIDN